MIMLLADMGMSVSLMCLSVGMHMLMHQIGGEQQLVVGQDAL